MRLHVLKYIRKLTFTLVWVFVGIVQFLKLIGVIELDFLNVNLLQNDIINDEIQGELFHLKFIS